MPAPDETLRLEPGHPAQENVPLLGDLFCGVGGFSLGAHLAGFRTAFAVDVDEVLTSSFKVNFPKTRLLLKDLAQTTAEELLKLAGLKPGELSGLIGGPPCQGFSVMGHRDPEDPRNGLLGKYFEFVAAARPAFFIMENVPHIMDARYATILESGLRKVSDYQILGPLLVDASRFGAATKRQRVVVIGYDAKRVEPIAEAELRALETDTLTTVRSAIHDLPPPGTEIVGSSWYKYACPPAKGEAGSYARKARMAPPAGLSTNSIRGLAGKRVSGLQNTIHSQEIIERISKLLPGGVDKVSKARKLEWEGVCTTLRAGTGRERGSHQAVRPIHPGENRVITVREAARIQGFPDWFQFHEAKWHSFRMIGNSVSPYLSEALLKLLKSKLKSPAPALT